VARQAGRGLHFAAQRLLNRSLHPDRAERLNNLAFNAFPSHERDVEEDWEQFFKEKSARRADKVQRRRLKRTLRRLAFAAAILAIMVAYFLYRS
jgi:hypothetical protein